MEKIKAENAYGRLQSIMEFWNQSFNSAIEDLGETQNRVIQILQGKPFFYSNEILLYQKRVKCNYCKGSTEVKLNGDMMMQALSLIESYEPGLYNAVYANQLYNEQQITYQLTVFLYLI